MAPACLNGNNYRAMGRPAESSSGAGRHIQPCSLEFPVLIRPLVLPSILLVLLSVAARAQDPPAPVVVEEEGKPIKDDEQQESTPAEAADNADDAAKTADEIEGTEDPQDESTPDENDGLADLDKATQLKVTAESLPDLNDVVDKLDSALEKGLDKDNRAFAEQLLIATLLQRATLLSAAILDRQLVDPP